MKGKYEIQKEEYDEECRGLGFPKMLTRISTDNRFDAVAFFVQMINESPHLHFSLKYTPER